jgi:hypothetical protein
MQNAVLMDLRKSRWTPTRPLGGWLATSHELLPDGSMVPVVDRAQQVFTAAASSATCNADPYTGWGLWNHEHQPVFVGVPTYLEFCGPKHPLAIEHGKVGLWTEGHLFDPADPRSWEDFAPGRPASIWGAIPKPEGRLVPTAAELAQADTYWRVATALEPTGRGIGFSAHGVTAVVGRELPRAVLTQAAVCMTPMNPHAMAQPLALSAGVHMHTPLTASDRADSRRRAEVVRLLCATKGYSPQMAEAVVALGWSQA